MRKCGGPHAARGPRVAHPCPRGCSELNGLGKSESSFQLHNLEAEDKNFVFEQISIMIPYLLVHH
jgi:hypothetical protein